MFVGLRSTHRPLSSSFLGLPYRILSINHEKELLRGLWVSVGTRNSDFGRLVLMHQSGSTAAFA